MCRCIARASFYPTKMDRSEWQTGCNCYRSWPSFEHPPPFSSILCEYTTATTFDKEPTVGQWPWNILGTGIYSSLFITVNICYTTVLFLIFSKIILVDLMIRLSFLFPQSLDYATTLIYTLYSPSHDTCRLSFLAMVRKRGEFRQENKK